MLKIGFGYAASDSAKHVFRRLGDTPVMIARENSLLQDTQRVFCQSRSHNNPYDDPWRDFK